MDNFDGKLPKDIAHRIHDKPAKFPEQFSTPVSGFDFADCNGPVDFEKMLSESYLTTGLQSTMFGRAVEELKRMVEHKLDGSLLTEEDIQKQKRLPINWRPTPCTIFMSYTSNLITSGCREIIRYLAEHKMIDVIVSTAGGIEEDFIKCFVSVKVGTFELSGEELFDNYINRNGNLLLSLDHYNEFENWAVPILDQMLAEQDAGYKWTPSRFIHRLGKEINHPDSVYYWAYKNNIPVFCPALTDGGIGDLLFFHAYKHDGRTISIDIVDDVRLIFDIVLKSKATALFLLGGGVSKHHILNANAMRHGGNYAVYVNTAQEFDGCDSGAKPDEAKSWGKINKHAKPVKVFSEVSLVLPLLVSQTFFKYQDRFDKLLQ